MTNKQKIIGAVCVLALTFAMGRYSVPTSVKEETKTAETDKKSENKNTDTDKDEHTKTIIVESVKPDGTKEKTTTITDDKVQDTKVSDITVADAIKTNDQVKEVTRGNSRLTISALAGAKVSFSDPIVPAYGAMISKDLIGPINVGVFGFSNGFGGVSLGLTF